MACGHHVVPIRSVYRWMFGGLLVTALASLWVAMSPVASRPPDALRSLLLDSYLIDAYKKAARR